MRGRVARSLGGGKEAQEKEGGEEALKGHCLALARAELTGGPKGLPITLDEPNFQVLCWPYLCRLVALIPGELDSRAAPHLFFPWGQGGGIHGDDISGQ